MANRYGLKPKEDFEDEYDKRFREAGFQIPGILPSQRGLEEPERSPVDLLAAGRSTERSTGGYGATGIGEEGEEPRRKIPGATGTLAGEQGPYPQMSEEEIAQNISTNIPQQKTGGLEEKPELSGFGKFISLPYRMQKAKLEQLEKR